jgi:hypothetical protein
MKKAPKQILAFISKPETYDSKSFETAIRNELELIKGEMTASEELLVGMLVMTVDTLIDAQLTIMESGIVHHYNAGPSMSPYLKIRTECLDKSVKIIKELGILGKTNKQPSDVDELFDTA